MKKLKINLQQTIFFDANAEEKSITNSIIAVVHESKNLIVFNVSYSNKDLAEVIKLVSEVFPEKKFSVVTTDNFRIDTWDDKIGEFKTK